MVGLTETHATAARSIATMVERKLEEIENSLFRTTLGARGVRIHHKNDLEETEIKYIQQNIDLLYGLLENFCAYYEIPKEKWSLKREIMIKVSFLWEELTDATGRKFSGYGEEGEVIMNEYVRHIEKMIEVSNNIYNSSENFSK